MEKKFNILHKEPIFIRGKDPEIGVDGWKDYYQCPSCGDLFEDPECTIPIDDLEAWKLGRGFLPALVDSGRVSNAILWLLMAAIGFAGAIICTVLGRKKNLAR